MAGFRTFYRLKEPLPELVRVNSRSSSGCSPDSLESSRTSRSKPEKVDVRNAIGTVKPPCTITLHVPDATQSVPSSAVSLVECNQNDWKVTALQKEVDSLRLELDRAKATVNSFQEREQKLKSRLAEQAQMMLERGSKFENVCLGDRKPTAIIRQYGNLYSQARVDTLDALDALVPLKDADELKSKILFSVIVLAFRSVQNELSDIKDHVFTALQVKTRDPLMKELEQGISVYLRKTAERFNLKRNMTDVCSQIYATLYDYPCLKNCTGLINYANDCVRLAWCLTNQNPPYVIDYETRTYRRDMHMRFHTSNQTSDTIQSYLWPTLLEGEKGACVHKGVVLT